MGKTRRDKLHATSLKVACGLPRKVESIGSIPGRNPRHSTENENLGRSSGSGL